MNKPLQSPMIQIITAINIVADQPIFATATQFIEAIARRASPDNQLKTKARLGTGKLPLHTIGAFAKNNRGVYKLRLVKIFTDNLIGWCDSAFIFVTAVVERWLYGKAIIQVSKRKVTEFFVVTPNTPNETNEWQRLATGERLVIGWRDKAKKMREENKDWITLEETWCEDATSIKVYQIALEYLRGRAEWICDQMTSLRRLPSAQIQYAITPAQQASWYYKMQHAGENFQGTMEIRGETRKEIERTV